MTSNMGARQIKSQKSLGFHKSDEHSSFEQMKLTIKDELKKTFNPELLNRIDETIIFRPLNRDDVLLIVDILLREVSERLQKKGFTLRLSESGRAFLADKGFDPAFGARPLKRAVQKYLEDPLAEEILKGTFDKSKHILVDKKDDDNLKFIPDPEPEVLVNEDNVHNNSA
jgi:ATP-dependent Clp protease ATP-binding subunit ClpC